MNGDNFVKSIVNQAVQKKSGPLKVVKDHVGSPTWSNRLALQIKELLKSDGVGTYHATAEGHCSSFEYAEYIVKKLGLKTSITPCKMKDLHRPAKRPVNCVLENRLLKKQGLHVMVDWKEDLDTFLEMNGKDLIEAAKAEKA